MEDNTPLYNSRLINNYVEYLKCYHLDIDVTALLQHAGIEAYELNEEGHWLSQKQVDRFHERLAEQTNNPDISREVGRYTVTSQASGALRQYLLGFISPATAYGVVEKINARLVRSAVIKIKSIGVDNIEAKVTLMPNVVEKPYQCLNRLGSLEAVAKIFTGEYAKIEHPICLHKGGDCCFYTISWKKTRIHALHLIRNISFILGFFACTLSVIFMPPTSRDLLVLSILLIVIGTTLYTEHMEKRELIDTISKQGDAADRLIDQINTSYNNALLIQEIGQATSMILEIDPLLAFIVEALEKRLDFDRGMIMLANRENTRLVYTIGYGYNKEHRDYLENIEFHLDNPNSRGAFVLSFRNQKPFLINDIDQIKKDFSPRSVDFAKKMGTHSFICVPIVFKGESLGVLVVDNIRSKRLLSRSEMSLLMGIAPQIAISIHNAMTYKKIAESEEKFRSLSEGAPDIIFTINTRGSFTYVNPAWERILGYSTEETIGKYFIDFIQKEEIPLCVGMFKTIRDGGITVRDQIGTLIKKDGTDRFFTTSGAPVIDSEGRITGVVGTSKDITDRKLAEEEKQSLQERLQRSEKMEILGQLAGGVAHDLNNVLGVLTGYSELLLADIPAGSRSRRYVEKILQSAEKGAAINEDLLTMARRGVTATDVINLTSVVTGFLKSPVFEKIKGHHPRLIFKTECDEYLLNIKGSTVHLEKTLMNLVSNAAEATSGEGGVTIRTVNRYLDEPIRGYGDVKPGEYVVLSVSDTGMGIPVEDREKIFEPFYTKKKMGRSGTGLGLGIVWGTVKDHNGYIDLQTEVGEGTTFTLYFPATREELTTQQQNVPIEQYMGKGESILVVDDVAEQREIATTIMIRLGYEVHAVSGGKEAVEYLKENKADILVLDMIMAPGIDGLETYQMVLEINPEQKAVIVSGFSENDRVMEAQRLGAGAYVKKPYVTERLGLAIRTELDRK